MRNYSEPPYVMQEISAVINGIFITLGKQPEIEYGGPYTISKIGDTVKKLLSELNMPHDVPYNLGIICINAQKIIDKVILEHTDQKLLKENIDQELRKVPPSIAVDFFTGEKKI